MTVRFTYRNTKIRIFGAGYWHQGLFMRKKIKYENAPENISDRILENIYVEDFLPRPGEFVEKEDKVKVTLNLSKKSVQFFKKQWKELGFY